MNKILLLLCLFLILPFAYAQEIQYIPEKGINILKMENLEKDLFSEPYIEIQNNKPFIVLPIVTEKKLSLIDQKHNMESIYLLEPDKSFLEEELSKTETDTLLTIQQGVPIITPKKHYYVDITTYIDDFYFIDISNYKGGDIITIGYNTIIIEITSLGQIESHNSTYQTSTFNMLQSTNPFLLFYSNFDINNNVLNLVDGTSPSSTNALDFDTGIIGNGLKCVNTGCRAIYNNLVNRNNLDISVSFWYYMPANPTSGSTIIQGFFANDYQELTWRFRLQSSGIIWESRPTNTTSVTTNSGALNTTEWYHVVGTRSHDRLILYVNGNVMQNVSFSGYTTPYDYSEDFRLGGHGFGTVNNMILDEVRYYNTTLSPTDVTNLYNLNKNDFNLNGIVTYLPINYTNSGYNRANITGISSFNNNSHVQVALAYSNDNITYTTTTYYNLTDANNIPISSNSNYVKLLTKLISNNGYYSPQVFPQANITLFSVSAGSYIFLDNNTVSPSSPFQFITPQTYNFTIDVESDDSISTVQLVFDNVPYNMNYVSGNTYFFELYNLSVEKLIYYFNESAGSLYNQTINYTYSITAPPTPFLEIITTSTNPLSPTIYDLPKNYNFFADVISSETIEQVILYFDNVPYNMNYVSGNTYFFELYNLSVGNYEYYIYSNSSTLQNQTSNFTYIINQATPNLQLSFSPSTIINNGTESTITGVSCPSQLTCILYRDGTPVSNPDIDTLPIGVYQYTYNTTGNTNYTSTSVSGTLTIQIPPEPPQPSALGGQEIAIIFGFIAFIIFTIFVSKDMNNRPKSDLNNAVVKILSPQHISVLIYLLASWIVYAMLGFMHNISIGQTYEPILETLFIASGYVIMGFNLIYLAIYIIYLITLRLNDRYIRK
jgi:hypothetical protein